MTRPIRTCTSSARPRSPISPTRSTRTCGCRGSWPSGGRSPSGRTPHDVLLDQLDLHGSSASRTSPTTSPATTRTSCSRTGDSWPRSSGSSGFRLDGDTAAATADVSVASPTAVPSAGPRRRSPSASASTDGRRAARPRRCVGRWIRRAGTGAPGLDLAFSWLQRSLDQLTEASRRTAAISRAPLVGRQSSPTAGHSRRRAVGALPAAQRRRRGPRPLPSLPRSRPTLPPPTAAGAPGAKATPLLDKIGRDLTKLAAEGSLCAGHRA